MQVTAQAQQIIALLHQKTLVPALEKVTTGAMPPVEEHRVGHRYPMHPTAQIGPMRPRNQMNMIAHQHKAKNGDIEASRRFCQQFYKPTAIPIIPKDPLPGVAPRANVIDCLLKFDSQRPGHATLITKPRLMLNVEI